MRAAATLIAIALLAAFSGPAGARDVAVAAGPGALQKAIAAAAPGDILRLGAGDHEGSIIIDKPLGLIGVDGARIVGDGKGTVISITASGVTIEGLTVTGSGTRLDSLDSGVAIAKTATGVRIIGNTIVDNLIGVDVQGGRNALVRGNTIIGREGHHKAELGSGVYVWNAPGLVVEDNTISKGRDGIFVTSSHDAVYRDNRMSALRFAFHSMNANKIEVRGNVSAGNDLGFAFMYSRDVVAADNVSQGDRTHGILLNYVTGGEVAHNAVQGGEVCLFVYNVNKARVAGNSFEGCRIGVHFTGGSQQVAMTGNAFVANRTQVKYVGTRWLEWSEDGRGNAWSDHVAFDVNGDGIADSPYRPNDSIDQLVWSQPMAKLLLGSPAVQLVKWSQSRFPGLLPGGVVDSHPLMRAADAGPVSSTAPPPDTREQGP